MQRRADAGRYAAIIVVPEPPNGLSTESRWLLPQRIARSTKHKLRLAAIIAAMTDFLEGEVTEDDAVTYVDWDT